MLPLAAPHRAHSETTRSAFCRRSAHSQRERLLRARYRRSEAGCLIALSTPPPWLHAKFYGERQSPAHCFCHVAPKSFFDERVGEGDVAGSQRLPPCLPRQKGLAWMNEAARAFQISNASETTNFVPNRTHADLLHGFWNHALAGTLHRGRWWFLSTSDLTEPPTKRSGFR